jgi:hypothetical protein
MRMRFAWAVAVPALLGGAALVALLPWGDPCSVTTRSGEGGCAILLSPSQQNLRNAAFLVLCLLVGCAAGLMNSSRGHLAGALSTPSAVLMALFGAQLVYGLRGPLFHMDVPGASYLVTLITIAGLVILGMIGGALSRYVRLTIVGGGGEAR